MIWICEVWVATFSGISRWKFVKFQIAFSLKLITLVILPASKQFFSFILF